MKNLVEIWNFVGFPEFIFLHFLVGWNASMQYFVFVFFTKLFKKNMCNSLNRTLINEMLHCYMVTARCKLFKEAGTPDTPPMNGVTPTALPYPQYVGVDRKLTYHGIMTHRVLVTHDF